MMDIRRGIYGTQTSPCYPALGGNWFPLHGNNVVGYRRPIRRLVDLNISKKETEKGLLKAEKRSASGGSSKLARRLGLKREGCMRKILLIALLAAFASASTLAYAAGRTQGGNSQGGSQGGNSQGSTFGGGNSQGGSQGSQGSTFGGGNSQNQSHKRATRDRVALKSLIRCARPAVACRALTGLD